MGCAQSRIENKESVSRCKERRNLMKEAVGIRNAFASAHSGYSISLKDTGAALSDYAQGEVPPRPLEAAAPSDPPPSERPPPPPPPPIESTLPPPPPPLPSFSPMPPLKRAVTMPATLSEDMKGKMKGIAMDDGDIYEEEEIDEEEEDEEEEEEEEEKVGLHRPKKGAEEGKVDRTPVRAPPNPATPPELKGMAWDYFFMDNMAQSNLDEVEEEEEEEEIEEEMKGRVEGKNGNPENFEFRTPEKLNKQVGFEGIEEFKTPDETPAEKQFVHSKTAPPAMSRFASGGNVVGNSASSNNNSNGVDLLKILSEVDDHFLKASQSAQEVSKMLEATRLHYHSNFADNRGHIDHAARVMQVITWNKSFRGVPNGDGTKDDPEAEDYETHATILDKLLAWEKKLFEEVKTGELMKLEYQRKVSQLNKLKKRNASGEQLEKAKAAVSHLHTRYIVDMQSLDSTVSEVNDIRDKQLYPKLVALVHGMAKMWESMCGHHDSQLQAISGLRALDASGLVIIETTKQHHAQTRQLASVVERWHSQFEKLVSSQRNYVNTLNAWLKLNLVPIERADKSTSAPSPPQAPPIQPLLRSWHDHLEKLPDEVAKGAISSFAAVIQTIVLHQEEEMKLKEKYEDTQREYLRKKQSFEEWYQKHGQRKGSIPNDDEGGEPPPGKDPVAERQFAVESLRKRLEEEMEEHQKVCVQVREKSLGSLKVRLPELFRALSDYAHACREAYGRLRGLVEDSS